MAATIKLGRIWGIPIGLHFSWFLIFGLVTWSLAGGFFPEEYPGLPTAAYGFLGAVPSPPVFGTVRMHERAHASVALRNKLPVRAINLFIFGGVAELTQEPRSAGAEFRIAIAGPLASLALAGLFGGVWLLDQQISYLAAPSIWLARINLLLALFNMIPGFPLDGGRILRAIVWAYTDNLRKATQIATVSGQVVAFGFISIGLYMVLVGNVFNGLWFILIGWFLQNASAASLAYSNLQESLRGVTVSQAMERNLPQVPGLLPLSQLVEENVLREGRDSFIVADNGDTRGLLTLADISAIPARQRRLLTTQQAMLPLEQLVKVEPDAEVLTALQLMEEAKVKQVPVVKDNQVLGLLSREGVFNYLRLRSELGA